MKSRYIQMQYNLYRKSAKYTDNLISTGGKASYDGFI